MDAADESEGRSVTDLIPPWTSDDGSWAALMSKSIELKRLFLAAASPPDRPVAPTAEGGEGEAAPPLPVDPDVAAEAASVCVCVCVCVYVYVYDVAAEAASVSK